MKNSHKDKKEKIDKTIRARIKKIKRSNLVIIISLIITIPAILYGYKAFTEMFTERIINNSILSMEELSKHDEMAIMSGLEHRWREIKGVATEVMQSKLDSIKDVTDQLNIKAQTLEGLSIVLVSSDGKAYSSTYTIKDDKELLELCKNSKSEKFVYRRENNDIINGDNRRELLLLGAKIEPFKVNDVTFEYVACYYDIYSLSDELKIDSYNGLGYSSVIDMAGNYLVSIYANSNLFERDNFFKVMESATIEDTTLQEIREKIERKESFSVRYVLDGKERVMSCTPMESLNWYFVMSVPTEVFQNRSNRLLTMIARLMGFVFFVVFVVIVLIFRNHSQKKLVKFEVKHRDELESALAMAEQASKAKTTFLNNMSHDIRTPMNAIIGFTSLAINHIDNKERVKDYLEKINQSSNHLLSLINDVLDMSRIESGRVNIEEKEENLAEILHGIKNIIQADIHAKQMELVIDTVDVTDENIYCDKLRLNQILINLISNAIKFTQPGGVISVRITQKEVTKKGYGIYEFKIKDTGIGIGKEFLDEIFEPFARERNTTVSGIQGTGLGMAITKNIVDMMGGTISVESEVGKGSEFTVTLEFKLQESHKNIEIVKELQGVRALVVDDDMNSCQSISHMLRQLGLKPDWTMYGKEAVERSKEAIQMKEKYQVYLIDWLMPDMNGIETTRRIRKAVGKSAPIILLSAYDWGEIEQEAKEAGVTEFISKPLFPSDLARILTKVCGLEKNNQNQVQQQDVDFSGRRILLVEDNMMNREIATEYLQDFGFLVECAEDGKIACDILSNSQPGYFDLVLMDIQMPIMDGYEATKVIRKFKNKKIANIPIIAMTANAFEEDKNAAKEAGMNGHLAKPIDIQKLIETLNDILK